MGTWRDVALILLSAELCLGALLGLAALVWVNYALLRLRWWSALPRLLGKARTAVLRGRDVVERLARICAAPIYGVESAGAGVQKVVEELVGGPCSEERCGDLSSPSERCGG